MIHQPLGGYQGQATDIQIHANEILKIKNKMTELYVKHTGQSLAVVKKSLERDNFMSAEDAKKFGLIDHVVDERIKMNNDNIS
jgi:ATP-dependent Clp protease protease subunit